MKILIWIGCIFANAIINVMFKSAGIILGAIPATALFCFFMWLARKLCQMWDERKDTSLYVQQDKNTDEQRFPNGYKCGNCGHRGPYEGACPDCGSTLKFRVADDEIKRCDQCDKSCETLTEIKICDDFGTRYRKVCAECYDKYSDSLIKEASLPTDIVSPRIMFCRKCGEKLIEDSGFCGKCGTKIVGENKNNEAQYKQQ